MSNDPEVRNEVNCDNEQLFDREEALSRLGDENLLAEVARLFLEDTPCQIRSLGEALAISDFEIFVRLAHTIKGSSANIGAPRRRGLAGELESCAKANDIDKARDLFPRLEREFERLVPMLRQVTMKV